MNKTQAKGWVLAFIVGLGLTLFHKVVFYPNVHGKVWEYLLGSIMWAATLRMLIKVC